MKLLSFYQALLPLLIVCLDCGVQAPVQGSDNGGQHYPIHPHFTAVTLEEGRGSVVLFLSSPLGIAQFYWQHLIRQFEGGVHY